MKLGLGAQLILVLRAPAGLGKLRGRGWLWLVVYLALSATVLTLVARWILTHQHDLRRLFVEYVFPARWSFAGDLLVERFFAAQERSVLVNGAIAASLLVVQVTLFPVKELLSAATERDGQLVDEPIAEHPLWLQAWEEVRLFLAFLAVQSTVFWIGYSSDPGRKQVAEILSYVYLFGSFGVDFLSPVLQRHRQKYATILKTLAWHPLLLLGFGALFSLPPILAGRLVAAYPGWSLERALTVLFAANVLAVAWAAVAGTHTGAPLLADARQTPAPARLTRTIVWTLLVATLAVNAYRFGSVARSLHHKSQLLKLDVDLAWTSLGFDTPGVLDLASGLQGDAVQVGLHFDVSLHNPTSVDVEIEDNRLEIQHAGQRVATSRLTPLVVPAGGKTTVRVELPLRLTPSQILRGRELLSAGGWSITWWLDVAPGFEFPIYLLEETR